MRRVPAERARHAKRLGHVSSGSEPANPVVLLGIEVTSTSSQTPPHSTTSTSSTSISTSTNQPSSSAPPTSSPSSSTQPPSSTPRSSDLSPTLSTSTSTYSPIPAITLSSSVIDSDPTPPTSSTSTTPHPPTGAVNRGLSGGAIAGIIAGGVIVGIALIVFFVRKTYLRRREKKRISWNKAPGMGGGLVDEPKFDPDTSDLSPSFAAAVNAPQRSAPLSPFDFEVRGKSTYSTPPPMQLRTMPAYAIPPPPSATYNNPAYPTQPIPLPYNPGSTTALSMTHGNSGMRMSSTLPSAGLQRAPTEAIVKCTFVPTLPDELSISTGERVFVVEQYDDGWDLCMNGRGERGMVPHECLDHAPSDQPDIGWRNVKRLSSLNLDGRRY